ncbi:MAG: GTP cyclohydrolase I FolE [Aerococcus sp.]|nr:GTP cyclohydrolase I FolE [Aerococcus sp.]
MTPQNANKQAKVEAAVRTILEAFGEDPDREGLQETPARVYRMFEELLATTTAPHFTDYKLFHSPLNQGQLVTVADIPFYSLCEHHMLPFFGSVTVAYLPQHEEIIGLSKIPRLVNYASHQLNVQERLTNMIGQEMEKIVDPAGVAVITKARHMCMEMRGVKTHESQTTATYFSGQFQTDPDLRRDFLLQHYGH